MRGDWSIREGLYGEAERASFKPKARVASVLETRRLSDLPYQFFLPYLPLAVCPAMPDALAEFCQAQQCSVDLVHWQLDQLLVPSLIKRQIQTNTIFGIEDERAHAFFNFANGIILQDEARQEVYRLIVDKHRMLEPGVSLAQPAEKILANQLDIHVLGVQSPSCMWTLVPAKPATHFLVQKHTKGGDKRLWQIAKRFWRRGNRTQILVE